MMQSVACSCASTRPVLKRKAGLSRKQWDMSVLSVFIHRKSRRSHSPGYEWLHFNSLACRLPVHRSLTLKEAHYYVRRRSFWERRYLNNTRWLAIRFAQSHVIPKPGKGPVTSGGFPGWDRGAETFKSVNGSSLFIEGAQLISTSLRVHVSISCLSIPCLLEAFLLIILRIVINN